MANKIKFGKGVTINTGNYESVRLDLALEVEVEPGETEDSAFMRAKRWVENVLGGEEKIIRDSKGGR